MSQEQEKDAPQQSVPLVIGAVATVLLLASLGQTIVSTALPTIVADLNGLDQITWVITVYLLASVIVAPLYGKFGDMFGRKIVLQVGIGLFLIGSAIAAFAVNMPMLIGARFVQGLGGGGLIVMAMTVVADVIPPRQRGKIQGLFGSVFGVSTVIGPLLGGFIVEHFSWHWIFIVNLPTGLAALTIIAFAFRIKPERVKHEIDYLGAICLTVTLSSIVLYTSLGGSAFEWFAPTGIAMLALIVVGLGGFIFAESRATEPVMPLPLFTNNVFAVCAGVGFIIGMGMFGGVTFLPLFLQVVKGVSPTASGLQLLPMMLGLILSSTASGFVMSRTGRYKMLPILASASMVAGMYLLSTMTEQTPVWQISLFMLLVGMGIGPVFSVGTTATQNAVPYRMVGAATAGAQLFRQIGGSIGVSAFGAIFAAGLAARLGDALPEGGSGVGALSPQAVAQLPDDVRDMVLSGFVGALHPVFLTASALGVIAFAISWMLKEVPLSNTIRREPEAEIEAEETSTAALSGVAASR